jgi:hypothetical protein
MLKKVSAAAAAVLVSGAVMTTTATTMATAHAQNLRPTATRSGTAQPGTKVVTIKMTAHQIRQTRTAGADTVVTLDNGQQITISTAGYQRARATLAAQKAHVTPNTTVKGNCGTAHVELNNTSTHLQYQMKTGFTVSPPAVEYAWSVYINGAADTRYEYHYQSSAPVMAPHSTWSGQHTAKVPAANDYEADIDIGGSWALTANTTFCSPGPASELTRIF